MIVKLIWGGLFMMSGYVVYHLRPGWYSGITILCCLIGAICNQIALQCNNGKMPVLGQTKQESDHCPMTEETKVQFLCDIFTFKFLRWSIVFSVGDIFLYSAIILCTLRIIAVILHMLKIL